MKAGLGKPIKKYLIERWHSRISSQFDKHKVVREVNLPLIEIYKKEDVDVFYKMWLDGNWNVIIELFKDFKRQHKKELIKMKKESIL